MPRKILKKFSSKITIFFNNMNYCTIIDLDSSSREYETKMQILKENLQKAKSMDANNLDITIENEKFVDFSDDDFFYDDIVLDNGSDDYRIPDDLNLYCD